VQWHAGEVTTAPPETEVEAQPRFSWALAPAFGVSVSAFLLFGIQHEPSGYVVLAISVILGFVVDRDLGKSLLLIGFGIGVIGTISLAADISYGHMILMGSILLIAVVVPYVVDRFVFKRHIVRFPINTGRRWTTGEYVWLVSVVGLAWLIMPFYFITSGTYLNWPTVHEPSELIRLFLAVNAVGLWDELFFICTAFALLRHHFVMWQANILQAIIFVSFLWELGYQAWGPFLTTTFALVQGYIFNRTRSLPYVVSVHLTFDCVLWAVLVHARTPDWLPIFIFY
jgi:membrane protease YdiL (CAAX protease family)